MTETITLDRAQYEAMVERIEELQDRLALAGLDRRIQNDGFDAATEDYLDGGQVKRLIAGEHPLRVWREKRGLTQRALADAAGINYAYLSEIESGKKPGSFDAMARAARALGISLDLLAPAND